MVTQMGKFAVVLTAWALLPSVGLACKCASLTPADLRANNDRIALVEVIALGPEVDGPSFIPNRVGHNRNVRIRVVEALAGSWGAEETVQETLRIGDAEFDCSQLYRRVGDKFILMLPGTETLVGWCNTLDPTPRLIDALRDDGKGK